MNRQAEKIYERLSGDDEAEGDSNSIINQKRLLEDYAAQHGFTNCAHYTDGPVKIGLNRGSPYSKGALV